MKFCRPLVWAATRLALAVLKQCLDVIRVHELVIKGILFLGVRALALSDSVTAGWPVSIQIP